MPPKKYCGKKTQLPIGYDKFGDRYSCLQAGIYIGKNLPPSKEEIVKREAFNALKKAREEKIRGKEKKLAIVETAIEARKKAKEQIAKTVKTTAIKTAIETKKKIAEDINKMGLTALKREIHLSKLNSRELSSIANRLHPANPFEPHYSSLRKQELIDELIRRGFKL